MKRTRVAANKQRRAPRERYELFERRSKRADRL
jgi:hypothetical protein